MTEQMQIGEVAQRTGLSLRTIRYYEEVGLVKPSARSQGGFRIYTEPDVARLVLVRRMKPLGFQLEQMREVLTLLDPDPADAGLAPQRRVQRLREISHATEQRCVRLHAELEDAEDFATLLRERLNRLLSGRARVG